RSPGFRKIGDSEHPPQPLLDLCDVRIGLQWQQDPARNPPRLTRTAIRHNAVDVGAQPILEVIAVAFLQTQFVVMDDDETVHSGIIVEVIRLDWCYISLMAAPYRACIRSAHVLMAAPSLEAARYRACASRRACIRSAHVLMAAPSLEAARYRACASRRAGIRSAHGRAAAPFRACIRSAHLPRSGLRT